MFFSHSISVSTFIFLITTLNGGLTETPAFRTTPLPTPDPSCTSDVKGLPACNFDKSPCSYTSYAENNSNLKWITAHDNPIPHDWQPSINRAPGSYMTLNKSIPGNPFPSPHTRALFSAAISKDITAICIEFHYSTSNTPQNISVWHQADPGYTSRATDVLLWEMKAVNTATQWRTAYISTCLMDKFYIAFESEFISTNEGVGIDYINITRSNRGDCPKTTMTPTTTRITPTTTSTATTTRTTPTATTTTPTKTTPNTTKNTRTTTEIPTTATTTPTTTTPTTATPTTITSQTTKTTIPTTITPITTITTSSTTATATKDNSTPIRSTAKSTETITTTPSTTNTNQTIVSTTTSITKNTTTTITTITTPNPITNTTNSTTTTHTTTTKISTTTTTTQQTIQETPITSKS